MRRSVPIEFNPPETTEASTAKSESAARASAFAVDRDAALAAASPLDAPPPEPAGDAARREWLRQPPRGGRP